MTYDQWKTTEEQDPFGSAYDYQPEPWEQLADLMEEKQRQMDESFREQTVNYTDWAFQLEGERLLRLGEYSILRKRCYEFILKCMGQSSD